MKIISNWNLQTYAKEQLQKCVHFYLLLGNSECQHSAENKEFMLVTYFVLSFNFVVIFPLNRGKLVLGYTEAELCMRGSGYQFIHAADMLYCAEYHIRSKLYFLMNLTEKIPYTLGHVSDYYWCKSVLRERSGLASIQYHTTVSNWTYTLNSLAATQSLITLKMAILSHQFIS